MSDFADRATVFDQYVNTPTIVTQSGSNSMSAGTLLKARSLTVTEGTWIVSGNVFSDASATASGYVKAALNLTYNTYSNYMTTQLDMDSNENDFGFSVMPMYLTVTEDTTVFLNFAREDSSNAVSLYTKIQAIKVG